MQWDKNFNNNFYTSAIQFQYNDTNIGAFLKGISQISEVYINQAIETLYSDVIDLRTAVGGALDMWGRRLGFPRYIPTDDSTPIDYINFNFYDTYFKKLKFHNTNVVYVGLPDFNYRIILLLLLAQQSVTPNIKAIDTLVNEIFKKLNISIIVKDTTDMSYITYIFKQEIPEWLGWIFKNYDVFPRPAGVGASYIVDLAKPFSFDREDIELNKEITNFYYGIFKGSLNNGKDLINQDPEIDYKVKYHNVLNEYKDKEKQLNDDLKEYKRIGDSETINASEFFSIIGKITSDGSNLYLFYSKYLIPAYIDYIKYQNAENLKNNNLNEVEELPLIIKVEKIPENIHASSSFDFGELYPAPEVVLNPDGLTYSIKNYKGYEPIDPDNPNPDSDTNPDDTTTPPDSDTPPPYDPSQDPNDPHLPDNNFSPSLEKLFNKMGAIINKYPVTPDNPLPDMTIEDAKAFEAVWVEISNWYKNNKKTTKVDRLTLDSILNQGGMDEYNKIFFKYNLPLITKTPDGLFIMK